MTHKLDAEALRDVVARAIVTADEQNGGAPWDALMAMGKHVRGPIYDRADAAIAAYEAAKQKAAPKSDGGRALAERLERNADQLENGPYVSLKEAREAFREAAAALRQLEWRPIETAPRDGTRFLAARFVPGDRWNNFMAVDRWHKKYNGVAHFNHETWPPTHWMPLPTAPQAEDEKK